MNFGLLHLARPEAAMAEAHRVLRHGGRYGFTVWATPEQAAAFGIVLKAIETYGTMDVGLPDGPPFFRFSDPRECWRSLEDAGFAQPDVRQLPLVWRLSSTDALFEAVSRGGVRTAAVLARQTPEALSAIRRAVARALVPYGQEDTVVVPMSAVLASATKT